MDDQYEIGYMLSDYHYVMAYGMTSLKNHLDYIMSQGGTITIIRNKTFGA